MTHPPYPGLPAAPDAVPPPPHEGMPHPVSSTRGLAISAALTAVVFTALEVIEVPLAFAAQDVYLDAADRGESAMDVWTSYDTIALPYGVLGLVGFVVTCLWLYRVRTDADIRHPEATHARRKGWAWAGWLVPVVNLWFPFQIVRDVLKAFRASAPTALLGWWWALYLLTNVSSVIGPQLTGFDEINTSGVEQLGIIEGINAALTVVTLVLWLAVIRRVDQAQRRTSTPPPDPSPVSVVA